jgi:hypothetical protein
MKRSLQKFLLTTHVATSVGCIGAVAAYLALAIIGLNGIEGDTARTIYAAMELIGWTIVTPLCIAALVSGIAQSLLSPWGLFRYYWIVAKLALTILTIAVLVRTLNHASETLAMSALHADHLLELRPHLMVHASLGLCVLVAITAISIYKPWGATPLARRTTRS